MANATVENRIFINGVPQSATKDDLAAYFSQFGATMDVYMPLKFGSTEHKGMCFVTYVAAESVGLALGEGHVVHGVQLVVDRCLPKDKGAGKGAFVSGTKGKIDLPGMVASGDRLFITKIPPEATREEVEALFSRFGSWTDVYLPSGSFPAGHKGICFISYSDPQSAQLAMQCGPHELRGQELVVDIAAPRDAKGAGKGHVPARMPAVQPMVTPAPVFTAGYPAVQAWTSPGHVAVQPMHVQRLQPAQPAWVAPSLHQAPVAASATVGLKPGRLFLTKVAEDVTKEDLTTYFQQYGQLQDVYVPSGKSIAFVSFSEASTASLVVQNPEHEVKPGRLVTVDLAYDRPPLEAKGKGKFRFQPYG